MIDDIVLGLVVIIWTFDLWEMYLFKRQLRLANETNELPKTFVGHYSEQGYLRIRDNFRHNLTLVLLVATVQLSVKTVMLMTPYHKALWSITADLSQQARPSAFAALHTVATKICLLPFIMLTAFSARRSEETPAPILILVVGVINIASAALTTAMLVYTMTLLIESFGVEIFLYFSVSITLIGIFVTTISLVLAELGLYKLNIVGRRIQEPLESLANRVGFNPRKIYVSEEPVPNASYAGLLGFSIIVITRALVSALSPAEVCAVVAHELGHWAYGLSSTVEFFLTSAFLSLGYLFSSYGMSNGLAFKLFSLPEATDRPHTSVLVFLGLCYVWPVISGFLNGLHSCIGRHEEFKADDYAARRGYARTLKTALMNLYVRTGQYPVQDRLFAAWYTAHPSLMERIQKI
ncbi:hypothetical protein GE061_008398 [Apolygus lucorum]|uniref:Uncharacterized protein n=1 Tax=Apolygus lucorum TaxID=248454 RepID=A0A6A4IY62_APOLU|nr:hypothetical protein GE061_008398 [Apolygus lucorum]